MLTPDDAQLKGLTKTVCTSHPQTVTVNKKSSCSLSTDGIRKLSVICYKNFQELYCISSILINQITNQATKKDILRELTSKIPHSEHFLITMLIIYKGRLCNFVQK